jgi:CRISPR/Cas system-associated exonuclease Cas4 (RecB family)
MYTISKSSFLLGYQCKKALYLNQHNKELKSKITKAQEVILTQGTNIGLLAQGLFPNGLNISKNDNFDYSNAIELTKKAISNSNPIIYEASFLFNDVFGALDILTYDKENWNAYEVKSSTEVKEVFILDAALQYYLITNSGVRLKDFFIIYINNKYGKLNINDLFIKQSVLSEIEVLLPEIEKNIEKFKNILKENVTPIVDIGLHCNNPYPCSFIDYCWKNIPNYSIFNIANLRAIKKFELYKKGIISLNEIPNTFPLNPSQWQQIDCELHKKEIVEKSKINRFTKEIKYPLYFLDFETFQLAIPIYDNSRPFQQLVFQYSLHKIESVNSQLEHYEFIGEINGCDPRISFIEKLIIDCGTDGDILVYNIGFEKTRLKELIIDFPQYRLSITKIINRLKDLMIPFKKRWYYTPAMRGSYSIKNVLPALVPEFSYNNLEIKNGEIASNIYSSMVQGTFSGNQEETKKALLEYCNLDTLAMVKLLDKLISV